MHSCAYRRTVTAGTPQACHECTSRGILLPEQGMLRISYFTLQLQACCALQTCDMTLAALAVIVADPSCFTGSTELFEGSMSKAASNVVPQ